MDLHKATAIIRPVACMSAISLCVLASGCNSTSSPGTKTGIAAGAVIGGIAGAVIGHQSDHKYEGAAVGAASGAAVGGLLGNAHDQAKKKPDYSR